MQFKRYDQTKPFIVLAIVIIAWMFVPFVVKRIARRTFFEFQAPIDTGAQAVRNLQDYWALRSRNPNDLIEAGKELAHLNSFYENKINETNALRAEVGRLEGLLDLPPLTNYRAEAARVLRRESNAWWQRIVINKGTMHGLPAAGKNGAQMPVIFVGGVVGRVTEVGLYTSVVELISNPSVRISAVIDTDDRRRPVNFQGRSSSAFSDATGVLDFVPRDDSIVPPGATARVVTSGLGGVFPPGISLGVIKKLRPDSDGLFQSAEVALDPRLSSVMEVTVLVPLAPPKGDGQ